uniref:Uncharacterized protein n=1 Tax=Timema bartmani TaxID=61472 RepID=A0A7R9F3F8_9NEOP|nr:unnamed protein product [Timema bartmani]
MELLLGEEWINFFDVVIVQARKPRFFTDESRPFRVYDPVSKRQLWDHVTKLEKGKIYYEGTVKQLQDMTGWNGQQVLYFGDHPYSDLADVTLEHGWRTGAIITELTHEIETLNNSTFKFDCNWLQMLTQLIEDHQSATRPEDVTVLGEWMKERDELSRGGTEGCSGNVSRGKTEGCFGNVSRGGTEGSSSNVSRGGTEGSPGNGLPIGACKLERQCPSHEPIETGVLFGAEYRGELVTDGSENMDCGAVQAVERVQGPTE